MSMLLIELDEDSYKELHGKFKSHVVIGEMSERIPELTQAYSERGRLIKELGIVNKTIDELWRHERE